MKHRRTTLSHAAGNAGRRAVSSVRDVSRPSLGAVFLPDLPPERLRSVSQAADVGGVDELWLWEDCFREGGLTCAAAVLAWTSRIRVAVGLVPVPLRNVALSAMETATLARLFPGRFDIGVGHGIQEWMAQVGARVDSPLTLLREYATALRALLGGERLITAGRYVQLADVGLHWPPDRPPGLFAGAVGPRTLELAVDVADGTILTGGTPPEEVRRVRADADAGSRDGRRHEIVVYVIAAAGPDSSDRLAGELRRRGLDPAGGHGFAGDAAAIAAVVARFGAAGADRVILQPTADDPDVEGFMRFVGRDVRAALDRS
jgi:alkanesulfonate monooxygenase SsuD/methylene tetrahydromethanopterin reductase-like flavin-dependent oxidoreductase (luciferase family)